MVVEILEPANEWSVPLPDESIYHGRDLEAREGPTPVRRWEWDTDGACWCDENDYEVTLIEVMRECLDSGWALCSVPPEEEEGP